MTQTRSAAADLTTALAAPSTAGTVERRIVSLAAGRVGCTGASITGLTPGGRLSVAATTDDAVTGVAATLAASTGESITRTVLSERTDVVCNDVAADARWPTYGPQLTEHTPVRSAAGFYVALDDAPLGVIAFHADTTDFFTEPVVEQCAAFVEHGALALAAAASLTRANQLEAALHTSRRIGMAMGILMNTHSLDDTAAFERLRMLSSNSNRKLRDVADELIRRRDLIDSHRGTSVPRPVPAPQPG